MKADDTLPRRGSDRIAALEAQVEALQRIVSALRPLRYCGVWEQDERYRQGCFVSRAGSMWHAQRDAPGKPGEEGSGWVLAVKRGRDGRLWEREQHANRQAADDRSGRASAERCERRPSASWVNR